MKYEYSVMKIGDKSSEDLKSFLDNMGENGWELIQIEKGNAIFKRSIIETKAIGKQLLNENETVEQSYYPER